MSTPRSRKAPAANGFAQRLKSLRMQKNLSQSDLAVLADIHFTSISRYERGTAQPNADVLQRLAKALSISGDYLIDGSPEEAAKAHFQDRDLLRQFKEVDQLPDGEKEFVKRVLDALLIKSKLQDLAR